MTDKKISRRRFHQTGATTLAFGLATLNGLGAEGESGKIIGANEQIRCAVVGVGGRGRQLIEVISKCENAAVVGLSDADSAVLDEVGNNLAPEATREKDFRKLIERDDVDALVIATPDHWHAFQAIEACKAGKDVYVETPLSLTVQEGRQMIDAARKFKRIVQVGLQRRSSPFYRKMRDEGIIGRLGKVTQVRFPQCNNMTPEGIGRRPRVKAPETLDWDLWLGPRYHPYQENIAPYKFRWWNEFGSPIAFKGIPYFDIIRYLLWEHSPNAVCAMGGKYILWDDRNTPDTMEVLYHFPSNRMITYSLIESSGTPAMPTDADFNPLGVFEMRGSEGTMYISDNRYIVKPGSGGEFQWQGNRLQEETFVMEEPAVGDLDITKLHFDNFFHCMRNREEKPTAEIEEAQIASNYAHIANISLALNIRLEWDGGREAFYNHVPANNLLTYDYRAPWKIEF